MRPGNHAAGDGSFGRSAGINVGKALALVAVAVVIGGLLLRHNGTVRVAAAGGTSTTAKPPKSSSPGTSAATTPASQPPTSQAVRPPSAVKVLVANGTSVGGAAARFSDKLHGASYDTLAATNTTARGVVATVIYYAANYQNEALGVAQQLGLQATAIKPMPAAPPVASLNGANILVIVGQDLAGSATTGGSTGGGGTTATTRHVVTTTTIKH